MIRQGLDLTGNQSICMPHFYSRCGYFPRMTALYEQFLILAPRMDLFEKLITLGFRHFGPMYWYNRCPGCFQCVPLRVPVAGFRLSKGMRRLLKRNQDIEIEAGPPAFSEEKFRLFHAHGKKFPYCGGATHSEEEFRGLFFDPPHPFCREYRYLLDGKLVGVGYVDETPRLFSSTYFFYDLNHPRRGLGKFSLLVEIERARKMGASHLYLGYYLSLNQSMGYKRDFHPCEVLLGTNWVTLVDERGNLLLDEIPLECQEKVFDARADFDLERDFPGLFEKIQPDLEKQEP